MIWYFKKHFDIKNPIIHITIISPIGPIFGNIVGSIMNKKLRKKIFAKNIALLFLATINCILMVSSLDSINYIFGWDE